MDYKKLFGRIFPKLLLTVLLFLIIFKFVSVKETFNLFFTAELRYIPIIILLIIIVYSLSVLSVWILLYPTCRLNIFTFSIYQIYSLSIGLFTPAQIGEGIIIYHLKEKNNIPVSKSLAILLFNKIINMMVIIILGMLIVNVIKIQYYYWYIFSCVIAILFFASFISKKFRSIIRDAVIKRYLMKYYAFFRTISDLFKNNKILILLNITINIIKATFVTMTVWVCFLSMGVDIKFLNIFFVHNFSRIAGMLPFSISGLGLLEGSEIYILSKIGFSLAAILSSLLLMRLIGFASALCIIVVYLCGRKYFINNHKIHI